MGTVRIITPFAASVVLFVLAYLSSKDVQSGFFPVMLFFMGVVFAVIGAAAVFSDKKKA